MEAKGPQIIGRYPVVPRLPVGLYSLDLALSKKGMIGLPLRTITELYGYTNVGKSTLAYYLSAKVGSQVTICDLEQLDRDYIYTATGAAGLGEKDVVRIVDTTDQKGKPITHEVMLTNMTDDLYDEKVGAIIWDSVGAVQPLAEAEGDYGEAFMGKRAKLVAQVARTMVSALRNKERPSAAFAVNHVMGVIGGRGHTTPGGDVLKFLAAQRIMLWPEETWRETSESDSPVIGFLVGGQIEKARFGGKGNKFKFYIAPGYGVHVGASAMFDCFDLGLAEQGATVKVDGKSLGYIRKDLLTYAMDGRQRKFAPFLEKIEEHKEHMKKEMKNVKDMDS